MHHLDHLHGLENLEEVEANGITNCDGCIDSGYQTQGDLLSEQPHNQTYC